MLGIFRNMAWIGLMAAGVAMGVRAGEGPALELRSAVYGVEGATVDVLDKLKTTFVAPDTVVVICNNASLVKEDPARGKRKTLTITYVVDGVEKTAEIPEGDTTAVSTRDWKPTDELGILAVFYGAPGKFVDVTGRVAEKLLEAEEFMVDNNSMGGDPAHGTAKRCFVVYSVKGQIKAAVVGEKKPVVRAKLT